MTGLIAGLPMYDFAFTAPALDAVWGWIAARLRAGGVEAPPQLRRDLPPDAQWRRPRLLLGQTCGYPYRHGLAGVVEILATPSFDFDGCEGANHCSFIVARRGDARRGLADFRGARAAINGRDSNTGMNLFRAAVAPFAEGGRFFAEVHVTGAHVASLAAISAGSADIAAVDCVTYGLLARHAPEQIESVRIVGRTPSSPALPFIASLALPEETRARARAALFAALREPSLRPALAALGLAGAEVLPPEAYLRIDEIEAEAAALGYPHLI